MPQRFSPFPKAQDGQVDTADRPALGQPPEEPGRPSKVLNNLARLIARYAAREHLSFTSPAPNDPVPPIPLEEGHSDVK